MALPAADYNDVVLYNASIAAWTDLTPLLAGTPPIPRAFHGLAAAADSLYVFGGHGPIGAPALAPHAPIPRPSVRSSVPPRPLPYSPFVHPSLPLPSSLRFSESVCSLPPSVLRPSLLSFPCLSMPGLSQLVLTRCPMQTISTIYSRSISIPGPGWTSRAPRRARLRRPLADSRQMGTWSTPLPALATRVRAREKSCRLCAFTRASSCERSYDLSISLSFALSLSVLSDSL